jgi:hypothetical protein
VPKAVVTASGKPPGALPEPPSTYAEWLPLFDRFGAGDDSVLEAMERGSLEWTSVVAERWIQHLAQALNLRNLRLQTISRELTTALDRAGGEAFRVSQALLAARRALKPLWRLTSVKCLRDDVRDHLRAEIGTWARRAQESLEKRAAVVRHNHQGHLLKLIRDNPLDVSQTTVDTVSAQPSEDTPPNASRGRRVLL